MRVRGREAARLQVSEGGCEAASTRGRLQGCQYARASARLPVHEGGCEAARLQGCSTRAATRPKGCEAARPRGCEAASPRGF